MMIMYEYNLYHCYETVTKTYKLNYNETDRPTGLQWISDAALINTNLIIAGTTMEQLKQYLLEHTHRNIFQHELKKIIAA